MPGHRTFLVAALACIFVLNGSHRTLAAASDACSLLTVDEVSAALEIKSLPGKHYIADSPKACMWSDAADGNINNRRVTLSVNSSATAFNMMKSSGRITTEALTGVGDEAFYEIPKGRETPILQVRKGDAVFTLRILNGLKSKPFTIDEAKTKEAALAKSAAGRF